MEFWQNIYSHFNPVAFSIGDIAVHWYGIMYALALLSAIFIAKWFIKYDNININQDIFDSYIWWAVIGVIIASILFCKRKNINFWFITDIAVLGVSAAYVFGRIGNFFNQELVGRVTDVSWGIYVDGILRHPSQLYEAFLEGIVVFLILVYFRNRKKFDGQLALMYGIFYTIARIIAEFYREQDPQIGFIAGNWLTMGILQSGAILLICLTFFAIKSKKITA